jgi:hypothetical protein
VFVQNNSFKTSVAQSPVKQRNEIGTSPIRFLQREDSIQSRETFKNASMDVTKANSPLKKRQGDTVSVSSGNRELLTKAIDIKLQKRTKRLSEIR